MHAEHAAKCGVYVALRCRSESVTGFLLSHASARFALQGSSYNGGMARKISDADAMPLLAAYARGEELTPSSRRLAARFALEELAERHPGKSVEVRVPYVGAVQVIEGLRHRRGTPPNVVEMGATTWMNLVCGLTTWGEVEGQIDASGTRSDLRAFFPLFSAATLARW